MIALIRVKAIEPLEGWIMRVSFTNDSQQEIDLFRYIADGEIFAPIRADVNYFRSAFVDDGTIAWPNGADIDPDVLYYGGLPPWAQTHPTQALQPPVPPLLPAPR